MTKPGLFLGVGFWERLVEDKERQGSDSPFEDDAQFMFLHIFTEKVNKGRSPTVAR